MEKQSSFHNERMGENEGEYNSENVEGDGVSSFNLTPTQVVGGGGG